MYRRLIGIVLLAVISFAALPARSIAAVQAAQGPLSSLLNQVPDTATSRSVMWYGSLSDFEQVLGVSLNSPNDFRKMTRQQQTAYLLDVNQSGKQVYYSAFTGLDKYASWARTFAINSYAIDREISVGAAPNWYGILVGKFQSANITAALKKLGYTTEQSGSATVYTTNSLAVTRLMSAYKELVVSDTQIIAAPSDAVMQTATSGNPIGADPAYAALVSGLEGSAAIPDGMQMLSAALFDGSYLADKVITADPLAASVGKTMSANQITNLRNQLALQNEQLLPRYKAAGMGYRRSATARFFTIVLVYDDPGAAAQANTILTDRLPRYGSFQQGGRQLFAGWAVTSKVSAVNNEQVVTVALQLPAQTDVSWIDLINKRDIGFLAVAQ